MTGLFDKQNLPITRFVSVIPKKDRVKVENRLLDGSFHIQTIGKAADILDVILFARNETVKKRVDEAEGRGEKLRIIVESKYWEGVIRKSLSWEKAAGTYKTVFEFLVTNTGSV